MYKTKGLIAALLFIILVALPSASFAALTIYYNPLTFASRGTILENYDYEDFNPYEFSLPGDPWTAHGVTYTTGGNVIVGSETWRDPVTNVICYRYMSPITADIDTTSQFSMFGFDLGYLGDYSLMSLEIYTNLNNYSLSDLVVPNASDEFNFYGAVTDNGEFFTGFKIATAVGYGGAPALDNVRLGNAQTVIPEPATLSLLGLGLLGLVFRRQKTS